MIKWIFRWGFRLFLVLLVLVIALLLSVDSITRAVVERRLRAETGLDVRVGSLSLGLLSPVITIENLKIYNRPEFGGSPLVDLPELHLVYDRAELSKHRLRCKLVRINLSELNLVQNKSGQINLTLLPVTTNAPAALAKALANQRIAGLQFVGIETLNVSAGKITALHMKNPSQVRELNLQLHNRIITNVQSLEDLIFQLSVLVFEQKGGFALIDFLTKS